MCYNCGCGLPDDDMGHKDNITESTFEAAALASHQSVEEAKKETFRMLKEEFIDVKELED